MDCRLPGSWLLVPTAARCQLQVHTEGMREEPGARGEGLWRKRSRGQEERDCGRFSLSAAATPASLRAQREEEYGCSLWRSPRVCKRSIALLQLETVGRGQAVAPSKEPPAGSVVLPILLIA